MKRASLLAAGAIVLVANAFALIHAWMNRAGPVETEIRLTESELPLAYRSNDDDSGITLDLRWMDTARALGGWVRPAPWLGPKTLQELGFDTSVAPDSREAYEFYRRQRARSAFVALEFDGPAWLRHVEQTALENEERAGLTQPHPPPHVHDAETHLVAIDAGPDAGMLRGRHPDRNGVIIVPAVVRIGVEPLVPANRDKPARPALLYGWLQEVPSSIHVPRPVSDAFRRLPSDGRLAKYRVHLRYGRSLEPWVVGVEFAPPAHPNER
jgi:hypothetical protein